MGVTFTTWCKKCGVEGPEMGDFGFVGAPTLGPAKKKGGLMPFGEIHDGFAALGMVTEELAGFKAFLDAHRGHPIVQGGDGEEDEYGDDADETPAPARLKKFRPRVRAVDAFYELACTKCATAYRSSSSERLVPFEPFAVDAQAIRRFRTTAASADDDDFYRVGGFPYDDVRGVDVFIGDHKGHPLQARLDRGPARPKAKAGPAPAAFTLPDTRIEDHERYVGRVSETTLLALAGLNHRLPARRAEACRAVRDAAEPGALAHLVALSADPSDEVRAAAADAMGALGDPRVARALGRFLLDHADEVRAAAARAAAARGIEVDDAVRQARTLKGPYPVEHEREEKVEARPEAVEAALRDPDGSSYEALQVIGGRAGEKWARDLLLVAAVDHWSHARGGAARALGAVDDPRALPFLLALVEDRHPSPAADAAEALGKRKAREAAPVLVGALLRGGYLAEKAGEALAAIADPSTRDALLEALGSPTASIQRSALRALGALRDPSAAPAIAPLLSSRWQSVREAAARALGATGGADAVAALARYAGSADENDRLRAAFGFGEMLPDPAAVEALAAMLDDSGMQGSATYLLGQAQDDLRVHAILLASHRRGNRSVVESAWRVLIRAGEAEKDLVRAMNYESPDEKIADYLASGHPPLTQAARRTLGKRALSVKKSAIRWGEGAR